jgi:hypothetical protein
LLCVSHPKTNRNGREIVLSSMEVNVNAKRWFE